MHFEFEMPDYCENGNYTLKITDGTSVEYIDFVYEKYLESDKITTIVINNGGYDYIDNNSYKAEISIVTEKNVAIGMEMIVEVTNQDGDIFSVGTVEKTDTFTDYEFYMPIDAISGEYVISAYYTDETGRTELCTKSFDFVKPKEELQILSQAKTSDGKKLTLENISDTSHLCVEYKNLTDEEKTCRILLGVYDKTGKLVSATVGEKVTYLAGEEKDYKMNISVSAENVGAIRLCTWGGKSLIKPHTDYYIIK